MRKKVVVTGATGFLGAHLCAALVKEFDVVGVNITKERPLPPGVKYIHADCRDTNALRKVFRGADFVFHTGALPKVQDSIDHPQETHDVNVDGTLSVLVAARDAGVKRVIFSSSAAVYGDQKTMPLREDMKATPKSPYGLHKYVGEEYGKLFSLLYDLPVVSLRYFNIYGPGADPNGAYALAIGRFFKQRQEGKKLTITGDGKQTRDFIHVSDVVRANILAAKSKKVGKGEVINIATGKGTSIQKIAALIGGPVKHIKPRIEPKHSYANISRAHKLLGWRPHVDIEKGISELKRHHRLS